MSKLDYDKKYLTRSKVGYSPYPNFGKKYSDSFFPYMTKLWNNLDVSTQIMVLPEFKMQLKKDLKPTKYIFQKVQNLEVLFLVEYELIHQI